MCGTNQVLSLEWLVVQVYNPLLWFLLDLKYIMWHVVQWLINVLCNKRLVVRLPVSNISDPTLSRGILQAMFGLVYYVTYWEPCIILMYMQIIYIHPILCGHCSREFVLLGFKGQRLLNTIHLYYHCVCVKTLNLMKRMYVCMLFT